MNEPILTVTNVSKTYASGLKALDEVNLSIARGEILALLGPNGAGKTTLISVICSLVTPSDGRVTVDGLDIVHDYRKARQLIGLVPQEISLEPFETVIDTVRFSRRLFGRGKDDAYIDDLLRTLSLWDKRRSLVRELSGGMKRRVLIAKALAHQPKVLFLDEPTAGVDVELRKDMWQVVRRLKAEGVTIILTTHYIEEAEAIADRVGIISAGRILLVEEKTSLMRRLGRRQVTLHLNAPLDAIPETLANYDLELADDGTSLIHMSEADDPAFGAIVEGLLAAGVRLRDVETDERSLEDIFVGLVREETAA